MDEIRTRGHSVLGTLGLVALAIVALSAIDTYLARTERLENRAEAERLAAAGRELTNKGQPEDAILDFKGALAVERENSGYWLSLGQAQLAAGEFADAEATLAELLRRDSTSGPANLTLARVLVKEGRIGEAVSAYHRAIYGHWEKDADKNRVNVRFELVNLLAQQGSKEELLAELLPLLDVTPNDLAERKRLGRLFLTAGSPIRAGEIFHEILRQHPLDADAYAGLGESEFAQKNYLSAHTDFQTALNLRPVDTAIPARLEQSAAVLALDPTRRGIGPEEQYQRSLKILEMAAAAVSRCGGVGPEMEDAQQILKSPGRPAKLSEAVETNLNLAEALWKVRVQSCKQPVRSEEEPLRLVIERIAQ